MLAFGMFRELFSTRDLARVYNVIMEKEVRVHGELEGMEDAPMKEIDMPVDVSDAEEQHSAKA